MRITLLASLILALLALYGLVPWWFALLPIAIFYGGLLLIWSFCAAFLLWFFGVLKHDR